ncbi:MAG TPA: hypothetical protein ENL22_09160 [candidate division Zixibacteria bacterium]|nr:hypothetical protein [candidate division Zixibacteria bacterium]
MEIGNQSEFGKIEKILIKHPKDAFISQDNIDNQWNELGYSSAPVYNEAIEEYEYFVSLLKSEISDIMYLPQHEETGLDSIYVRDSSIVTPYGMILCSMGKPARQGEAVAVEKYLKSAQIPILGSITGDGRIEGGDLIWLDKKTIAVGRGYRTNDEGIRQLCELTSDFVDDMIIVHLPHWKGPGDVFHLMSIISPIDTNLALVYSRLMPVSFRELLTGRGMRLLDVPDSEFESMGCNVLTIAPRKCIMLKGNNRTRQMLEDEGVEVLIYKGDEISRKGAGGPTCLTRPLLRIG